jgi:soluble lytic murein transglycosylase-like protein
VRRLPVLALAISIFGPVAVAAAGETFKLEAPDGTVHLTNVPTDPSYRRLGIAPAAPSGTQIGWFRLPGANVAPYLGEIRLAADRYGVPEQLISALIRVESAFNPRAVSNKGARGLMQLMPGTAAMLGVRDSFDPRENIDGGVRHLRALMERFGGDLPLVLAAYNAGEQAVLRHRGVPPYPETQDYVTRVLRHFTTAVGQPPADVPSQTFRKVEKDGTIVYTNIPPRGKL